MNKYMGRCFGFFYKIKSIVLFPIRQLPLVATQDL